jgi:hypothetical protein
MTPLRTAQAITAQTGAILVSGEYVTETDLDNKVASLGGTGLTFNSGTQALDVDNPFNPSGDFAGLRARATTAEDVGINDVQLINETVTHYNDFFGQQASGEGFGPYIGDFFLTPQNFTENNGTWSATIQGLTDPIGEYENFVTFNSPNNYSGNFSTVDGNWNLQLRLFNALDYQVNFNEPTNYDRIRLLDESLNIIETKNINTNGFTGERFSNININQVLTVEIFNSANPSELETVLVLNPYIT